MPCIRAGGLQCAAAGQEFYRKTLSYFVPYATTEKSRPMYLNTLIKQAELEPVIDILHQIDQIGADAMTSPTSGLRTSRVASSPPAASCQHAMGV